MPSKLRQTSQAAFAASSFPSWFGNVVKATLSDVLARSQVFRFPLPIVFTNFFCIEQRPIINGAGTYEVIYNLYFRWQLALSKDTTSSR